MFGIQHEGPTSEAWYRDAFIRPHTPDAYKFFMDLGPLSNADQYYGEDNFFWQELKEHPNYDAFWQARNILPHLRDIDHAVLTVGGWFDAEDLYGPLNIYQTVERNNPGIYNALVMGPFSHGQWARGQEETMVGEIHFGTGLSEGYQRDVEAPFFRHFLKGEGAPPRFEAYMFDTGRKRWHTFADWPAETATSTRFYLRDDEREDRDDQDGNHPDAAILHGNQGVKKGHLASSGRVSPHPTAPVVGRRPRVGGSKTVGPYPTISIVCGSDL